MDDPSVIVKGALDLHTKMIKQMKRMPGVTAEELQKGLNPRHCALSLVGEPIMYPEINALVDELELVTNAQFPEKILMMKPSPRSVEFALYMHSSFESSPSA